MILCIQYFIALLATSQIDLTAFLYTVALLAITGSYTDAVAYFHQDVILIC